MKDINLLQQELNTNMEQEDLRWKQRAKRTWYKLEDRNTNFFHTCATQRRKQNSIKSISTNSQQVYENEDDIVEAFQAYFETLFTNTKLANSDIAMYTKTIEPISGRRDEHQTELELHQRGGGRNPKIDGAPKISWTRQFWSWFFLARDGVCVVVLHILHGVNMNSSFNSTFIALFQKKIIDFFLVNFNQ